MRICCSAELRRFGCVACVLLFYGVLMVFCGCVVQFPLTLDYAVFDVVSGVDTFRFLSLWRFLMCLVCLEYVYRVISGF